MPFWERAWVTFMSDPTTVIGIAVACLISGWWFRGFLHKERVQILKDQLSQAQRDADTSSEKFVRVEAQFSQLQNQIALRAPTAQLEVAATSTATLLGEWRDANATLQHTLTAHGAGYGVRGNDAEFKVIKPSA